MTHCSDVNGDRALGERWELEFCKLAARFGKMFTPHQVGRNRNAACAYSGVTGLNKFLLPDITIWTAPGEHHEIKHKAPTNTGYFGLEAYRFDALKRFRNETNQRVYYTIHNHNGDRNGTAFCVEDWITADIQILGEAIRCKVARSRWWDSYVDGVRKNVSGWFWPEELWFPLIDLWKRK